MPTMTAAQFRAKIRKSMPASEAEQFVHAYDALLTDLAAADAATAAAQADADAAQAAATAADARVTQLKTDFNTLVTKLNADAVEQNAKAAFPLTIDTNYAASTA